MSRSARKDKTPTFAEMRKLFPNVDFERQSVTELFARRCVAVFGMFMAEYMMNENIVPMKWLETVGKETQIPEKSLGEVLAWLDINGFLSTSADGDYIIRGRGEQAERVHKITLALKMHDEKVAEILEGWDETNTPESEIDAKLDKLHEEVKKEILSIDPDYDVSIFEEDTEDA